MPLVWIALTLLTSSSNTVVLATSFFTALLILLKSMGVVSNLLMSNLFRFNFNLAKSAFLENFDISMHVALLN